MKDIILNPNRYTYALWNDILIPKLVSAGWVDLGTQTVNNVNIYGTNYNETFRGVRNSRNQVFCLENGAFGFYTIIPSVRITPGNFVPNLTELNWRVVGLKTPKANDDASNPYFNNNFVFYYNDHSFILIDISNIKTSWSNNNFYRTRYNPILMFLSLSNNTFLISGFPLTLPYAYFKTDIIAVRNGVYIYNEDAAKNTQTSVLSINSNLVKTGFHFVLPFNPSSGYLNVAYPKIFINNELIDQDYVVFFTGAYEINHNTQIGNWDIFYLHKGYPSYYL